MSSISNAAEYSDAFITRLPSQGSGVRVAIKDLIDVAGVVTSAGCKYLAEHAKPAREDAACLSEIRKADASIVGKTNLHELAFGTTGVNSWSGTPKNPLGSDLIPGGSSSGSAVAVAIKACDFALGTDTGGSVRIPSACCGTAGLKTTYGRVPLGGVRPLAPSLDIVGPMARDVAGLIEGMRLLVPGGITPATKPTARVGRLRVGYVHPSVDEAVDRALRIAGFHIVNCGIDNAEWEAAIAATNDILWAEAAMSNMPLRPHWNELQNGDNLEKALTIAEDRDRITVARNKERMWKERLADVVDSVGLIASPTTGIFPPTIKEVLSSDIELSRFTSPVNLSGLPAIVIPIPSDRALPSSLQLIGPSDGEELLLATASVIEEAVTLNSVDVEREPTA